MNREILFRGKRTDNNDWVYGSFINTCDECEISDINCVVGSICDVHKETIGQYTGLNDKNGTKIFEGDIIKKEGIISDSTWITRGRGKTQYEHRYKLKGWSTYKISLSIINGITYTLLDADHDQRLIKHSAYFGFSIKPQYTSIEGEIVIIGNIHDKQE